MTKNWENATDTREDNIKNRQCLKQMGRFLNVRETVVEEGILGKLLSFNDITIHDDIMKGNIGDVPSIEIIFKIKSKFRQFEKIISKRRQILDDVKCMWILEVWNLIISVSILGRLCRTGVGYNHTVQNVWIR